VDSSLQGRRREFKESFSIPPLGRNPPAKKWTPGISFLPLLVLSQVARKTGTAGHGSQGAEKEVSKKVLVRLGKRTTAKNESHLFFSGGGWCCLKRAQMYLPLCGGWMHGLGSTAGKLHAPSLLRPRQRQCFIEALSRPCR